MKYLVIDTETSGLMDFKKAADAPGQPRVASAGFVYLDDDLRITEEELYYFRPNGWEMEPGATAINGLTNEFLMANGTDPEWILDVYSSAITQGRAIVAFNAQFDCKMMRAELRLAGMDDLFDRTPNICTMRGAQDHAKRVGRRLIKHDAQGRPTNNTGWPKLGDLCIFCGVERTGEAHTALADARDAALCFRAMVAEGFSREPEVHRSKNFETIRGGK